MYIVQYLCDKFRVFGKRVKITVFHNGLNVDRVLFNQDILSPLDVVVVANTVKSVSKV